ncbi:MAG: DUF4230 domain-containing protein [Oscillospiraceae bacterium]|nr:DUF4230 domain-containing protein [Oscillospiraceae bacterium]
MKKTLIGVVIGMVLGAARLFGILTYLGSNPTGKVSTFDDTTIEYGLHDIGELATESYNFTKVETYESTKQLSGITIPFTRSKFIYSYNGVIKAGIEFGDITLSFNAEEKTVTVKLPKVKILSSELDFDSFKLYDEKNSIFNPIGVEVVNESNNTLLTNAEKEAVQGGLLDRAEENAKVIITNFINGYLEDYTVIFE